MHIFLITIYYCDIDLIFLRFSIRITVKSFEDPAILLGSSSPLLLILVEFQMVCPPLWLIPFPQRWIRGLPQTLVKVLTQLLLSPHSVSLWNSLRISLEYIFRNRFDKLLNTNILTALIIRLFFGIDVLIKLPPEVLENTFIHIATINW